MSKEDIIATIRKDMQLAVSMRRVAAEHPESLLARVALRGFQSDRMAITHSDLLASAETRPAALFFLTDLYGTDDLTQRDTNLERVIPKMERLLPTAALATVSQAIALDALSEQLDAGMAQYLGKDFTEADYISAYRKVGIRADRERQIALVESVGTALCELVRVPMIGKTLTMMRMPARLANLADLQGFLERGFQAFKGLKQPHVFVATIVEREREIMRRLYDGSASPFKLA